MAFRTGDPTRDAPCMARPGGALLPGRRGSGVSDDQARDVHHRRHVVRMTDLDRVTRHLRKECLFGILHDGGAAVLANHPEAHASVVQRAGENHADDPILVGASRTAKQRIDRRAMAVLFRAGAQPDASGLDQQV